MHKNGVLCTYLDINMQIRQAIFFTAVLNFKAWSTAFSEMNSSSFQFHNRVYIFSEISREVLNLLIPNEIEVGQFPSKKCCS